MLTEKEIMQAFDYLRDSAVEAAQARYDKTYHEQMRKAVKATMYRLSTASTIAGKEAEAYASEEYKAAVEKMAEADKAYELVRARREAAVARIEAWRTFCANNRGAHIAVS